MGGYVWVGVGEGGVSECGTGVEGGCVGEGWV